MEVDVETYLRWKSRGGIREAWVEGTELLARIDTDVVRFQSIDPPNHYMRARLSSADLSDPKRFNRLVEGLPPDKFHYIAGR